MIPERRDPVDTGLPGISSRESDFVPEAFEYEDDLHVAMVKAASAR
jgi:hypothetical protein